MKKFFLVALIAVAMTSCMKPDDIRVLGLEDISVSAGLVTTIDAVLEIENASCNNVKLFATEFELADMGARPVALVALLDDVVIPRKGVNMVHVPLRITITNPLLGLRLFKNLDSQVPDVLVTGEGKIKVGGVKKKYEVNKLPLSAIISTFEPPKAPKPLPVIEDVQSI